MWLVVLSLLHAAHAGGATNGAIRIATWNMSNFPSGLFNVRKPDVERYRISESAVSLRQLSADVLLLQEVRDRDACQQLADALGPLEYRVLACSAFRDQAGVPEFQQVAIVARLTSLKSGAEEWHTVGIVDPPRGFAYAIVETRGVSVVLYSLHLKSNLVRGRDAAKEAQLNMLKRELAAAQVLRHFNSMREVCGPDRTLGVIGGDLNTDPDDPALLSEGTIASLESAGFSSCFKGVPADKRVTCPGRGHYRDATFDYIFTYGMPFRSQPLLSPSALSDHFIVTVEAAVPGTNR